MNVHDSCDARAAREEKRIRSAHRLLCRAIIEDARGLGSLRGKCAETISRAMRALEAEGETLDAIEAEADRFLEEPAGE